MELLKLRKERGLLQREIAAAMGIATTTYLSYEKNINEPSIEMLCRLADYFNVSVDELLGRTGSDFFENSRIPKSEIQELYDRLPAELQKRAIAYLHGLTNYSEADK